MRKKPLRSQEIPHADLEQRVLELAGQQYGRVTRAQLRRLGMTVATIDARVQCGRLVAKHAGVYEIGPPRNDARADAMAAVLACGKDALLSHSSAAALWGINRRWIYPLEVTAPTQRERPGIRTHRSRTLAYDDRRRRERIPVTSPARTILDNAPNWTDQQLTRAINDLRRPGHLNLRALQEVIDRNPNYPDVVRLRAFVKDRHNPTRSDFEDLFLAFAKRFDLPTPRVNVKLNGGYEVDAVFDEAKLIVELDSWEFHSDRNSFATDRERDAHHLQYGHATVRIVWERLTEQPAREAARLHHIIRARLPPR